VQNVKCNAQQSICLAVHVLERSPICLYHM